MKKINTIIYGATGSIGKSALSIIEKNPELIRIEGVTCNTNVSKLYKIAKKFNVKKIGFNEKSLRNIKKTNFRNLKTFSDCSTFHDMISSKTDVIIYAISGLQSLDLLIRLLKTGKKIGIANKECIISLGYNFNKLSKKYNTEIIPLDSEHNSIYHLLKQNLGNFKSITLTASGGPFFNLNKKLLNKVSVEQAVKHPIWNMGKKISIDSATLMNKALEIIEAKYLFNLDDNQLNAVIHPQAIIHALINYENGVSTAMLNNPDMRIPISSLFFKYNKYSKFNKTFDITKQSKLEFFPIDEIKFPALRLAFQVMKMGGLAPHIFNYLNEKLVHLFMEQKIKFVDIVKLNEINLEKIFSKNSNISKPNLSDMKIINYWIDNNIYIGN